MTKKMRDAINFHNRAQNYGIKLEDAYALRRIEMTLHRWAEHECNGTIQRDGENGDGAPRWYYETATGEHRRGHIIADRERGALKRLEKIMQAYPELEAYHQGDPRGCALYLVPKKLLSKETPIDSIYSQGFAVCY